MSIEKWILRQHIKYPCTLFFTFQAIFTDKRALTIILSWIPRVHH